MSPMIAQLSDGGTFRSVAPCVRFPNGKCELVMGVTYTKDGNPSMLLLAMSGREVSIAEVELIDPLPPLELPSD